MREKSQPQFMHIMTCVTGTRVGGLSPRLTPSLSRIWSNGVRRAAGSGDQLGRRPDSCRGVCVCVRRGGVDSTLHPTPPPHPPGRRPRLEMGGRGQALGCTGTALSWAAGRTQWGPDGRRCSTLRVHRGPGRPAHLHAVLEGGQRLGLVVLGEGPAHAAVPLVPLRTGAAGTSQIERGLCTLSE